MFLLRALLLSASVGALMAGCANQLVPDFLSSWKPLGELPNQVAEIPLVESHVYQVAQLDATVKGLLERRGGEAKASVVYGHTLNFTLYKKISTIRNTKPDNALSELSKLYEDKGMIFHVQNGVTMAHKKMDVAVKNSGRKKHERSVEANVKTQD